MVKIVRKLLGDCIRTSLILLDREFFTTGVIHELKLAKKKIFLILAKKTAPVKKATMQYHEGTGKSALECKIHSASKHVESYNLVIIPNPKSEKPDILGHIWCLQQTLKREKYCIISITLPEEYRARCGIETGYACVEKFRPRTTS